MILSQNDRLKIVYNDLLRFVAGVDQLTSPDTETLAGWLLEEAERYRDNPYVARLLQGAAEFSGWHNVGGG